MPLGPSIFLAAADGIGIDVVVWLVAGAIWLVSQMATAKKQKEKKARQAQAARPPAAPGPAGGGAPPTPAELAEIFKRLGADIPATPPPVPPRPAPARAAPPARKPGVQIVKKRAAERIRPLPAQRPAKAKEEAAAAADLAEAERIAAQAIVQGVQSRAGETRALDTATRHTGAILPWLYAMSMRMPPLPTIPMPGLDRTHHVNPPLPTWLHTRREIRDALIAQTFLQPAKGLAR